jgi:hypothetical protein|tara:strand:- start:6533 stop:6997 length:465 start_codon:yes stop_codon:yes gene_type:complete
MGYEYKLKESKTRMNNIFKLLGAFLLILVILPAFAEAQSMNPDSLLEIDPQIEQEIKPEAQPTVPDEWKMLNRLLACNTMEHIKELLLQRGQIIWAGGGKNSEYMPNDPFDAIIITRNPETLEFTIMLIKPDINLACIIAGGQEIKTMEEINTN